MPERLHPGVHIEVVKPAVPATEGVGTATAAFIGIAERGPASRATLASSFAEYQHLFGGDRADSFLVYPVDTSCSVRRFG